MWNFPIVVSEQIPCWHEIFTVLTPTFCTQNKGKTE